MRPIVWRLVVLLMLAAWTGGCGVDVLLLSFVDRPAEPATLPDAKLPGHLYLLPGLLGEAFSKGLDRLAEKVNHGGVSATVHGITEYSALADEIVRKYQSGEDRGPIMLVGHSAGAELIIPIAQRLGAAGVPVALAVLYDPNPRLLGDAPAGVELFIDLYQSDSALGGGVEQPGPGFHGRLINVDLREHSEIAHVSFDKVAELQDAVVAKVLALARYDAAQAALKPNARPRNADAAGRPLLLTYTVPREAPIELWDSAATITVKPGETVESIASDYGVPVWAIVQINALEPGSPLAPGSTLTVPRSLYTDATATGSTPSTRAVQSAKRGSGG